MPDVLSREDGSGKTRVGKEEGPLLQVYEAGEAYCLKLPSGDAKVWRVQESAQDLLPSAGREKGDSFDINNFINFGLNWPIIVIERSKRKRGANDRRQWRRTGSFVTVKAGGDEPVGILSQGFVSHHRR